MSDGSYGRSDATGGSEGMPKPTSPRDRIIEALMKLAAEREWRDFTLSDVAMRADVTLADLRDAFPSKGAILGGLSKKIDRVVLEGTTADLVDETAKERLFDVLMRRLDAMAPYKLGFETVAQWVRRDPLAAAALNAVALNAMRFMLEAAGIDPEKGAGALKLQGLVLAWTRVLDVWFKDHDPGQAATMAALDRELRRGETLAARVDDMDRLLSPFRLFARSLMDRAQRRDRGSASGIRSRQDPEADVELDLV